MRCLLLGAAVFLVSAIAAAADAPSSVVIQSVTVNVAGTQSTAVEGATVSRQWLLSWTSRANEAREVTLQPVGPDGRRGTAVTHHGCTLTNFTGLEGSTNVARGLALSCRD